MKKNIYRFLIIIFALQFSSCEEEINFQSPFREEPFLFCIVDIDSNIQYAVLKNSYEEKGSSENYISNANIIFESSNETTVMEMKRGDGITFPNVYYSTYEFIHLKGSKLSIRAILEDNTEISSIIDPPSFSLFYTDQTEMSIPFLSDNKKYELSWNINKPSDNIAFIGLLNIEYSSFENGQEIKTQIEVPQAYATSSKGLVPINYTLTENYFQIYSQDVLDQTFMKISESDTSKSRYAIYGAKLELYIMEQNLATYFSSSETFKNSFSLKLYENTISNIDGGNGIFGAFLRKTIPVVIDSNYIKSFGYNVKTTNN